MNEGTRVVVGTNGYDDMTPGDPNVFKGQKGVVAAITYPRYAEGPMYYIAFENPLVNDACGEPAEVVWPFHPHELAAVND